MSQFLTAKEAAERLGISLATLYSYVSRGHISSESISADNRQRGYSAADIDRLLKRKSTRKDPDNAAYGALKWGTPVLDSKLTLIEDGRLYYRGRDAVELARTHALEEVAALLWTGNVENNVFEPDNRVHVDIPDLPLLSALGRMQVALALAEANDFRAYDLQPEGMINSGVRILRLLVDTVAPFRSVAETIAEQLAATWLPSHPSGVYLTNLALVLCADHELNVSSFTARVVASAGTTPYAIVSAGLAALSGVKHGSMTSRVEAFFQEVETIGDVQKAVTGRLQRGELIPGFGHKLYPQGDPRGKELVQQALQNGPEESVALIESLLAVGHTATNNYPTIDFGLCALSYVLDLPMGAPFSLFALGRTVGWLAHALEQSKDSSLIRPRARYTGIMPET